MTALNGQFAISPQGGYTNANITTALASNDSAWIGWPPLQADIVGSFTAAVARGAPAQPGYALNGMLARSYADDYYDRVHLRPDALDLGQLSTSQQRSIEVWNAWRTQSLTLSDVQAANADGITVTSPGAFPLVFTPLQSRIWQISVTPSGPNTIDALLTWLFADPSQDVSLEITGNRLTAWTILPDWSNGMTETLLWLNDVGEAVAGDQARVPLRGDPRRQWEAPYIAYDGDRQLAESLLYGMASRNYVVPVWWDGDVLAAPLAAGATTIPLMTAGRDYAVGAQVLLRTSAANYELVEVAAVNADSIDLAHATLGDWPLGADVWPCRQAALTDTPQITRQSDWLAGIPIRFEAREPCDWTAIAPATLYQGYPVLEIRPDESNDLTASFARKLDVLDNQIAFPVADDISGLAWPVQSHPVFKWGRGDNAAFRNLLYWLAGRANALWVPSWQNDVTLTALVSGTGTTLPVRWCGIARYLFGLPGRKHLRIELKDGTVLYRAVTAAAEVGQQSESLAIDSALGQDVTPADVLVISWMALCTLSSDSVEIQHETDDDGICTCALSFAGVPAEEP
jgi:hypothetical protein